MAENMLETQIDKPGGVRQIAVPADARALSTLSHIDYEDAFLIDLGGARARSAEHWMRDALESSPAAVRGALQAGWTTLGLKLGEAPPERSVLGWEIWRSTPDFVLLRAGSRIGMPAELLLKRQEHGLVFSTFVQHDNHAARVIWAGTEPLHVPIVRRVLADAARRFHHNPTRPQGPEGGPHHADV